MYRASAIRALCKITDVSSSLIFFSLPIFCHLGNKLVLSTFMPDELFRFHFTVTVADAIKMSKIVLKF